MKKWWFILHQFLYKSEGKTINTYLNLTGTTIRSVVLYTCESWGDPKDQNNIRKIEKFHPSLCTQILGVKNITSSLKELGELGRFPLRISIERQLFKYLQRIRLAKKEELINKESGCVTKMRDLLDSNGMSNLILNIFKALNGEIDKKEYKNMHKFFQKKA